ncbi:hypothetical protein [Streptomyces inhibens]|uniref:hypothetical protein n=1 Tax=Streptomyces inhibens TaxID=2293571 RepID=UPI001EE6F250|nr:hypothetical protein [Streptomyces inhibens]UKY50806.1 hypothetical protein KI385_19635 [Streptomyces inhibens]
MDWNAVAAVAVAVAGVIGVLAERHFKKPRHRDIIKADLEILALLPAESAISHQLSNHIDETIRRVISVEDGKRRDAETVIGGLIFLGVSGGLVSGAAANGGAWWWLAAAAGLIGVCGITAVWEGARRQVRDSEGFPVER